MNFNPNDLEQVILAIVAAVSAITAVGVARWFRKAVLRELRDVVRDTISGDERLAQLLPNDGNSINDRVKNIEKQIKRLVDFRYQPKCADCNKELFEDCEHDQIWGQPTAS